MTNDLELTMTRRRVESVCEFLLVITMLALVAGTNTAQQGQIVPQKPPPVAKVLQTFIQPQPYSAEALVGQVKVYTTDKRLGIAWSFDGPSGREFNEESFDLAFWPTAAARISDDRLTKGTNFLVAGKKPSIGTTVIER